MILAKSLLIGNFVMWRSEEPIEDNVSADSGVSLTPSSTETPPQSEPTSEQQSQQQQQSQPTNLEAAQAEASKKAGINLDWNAYVCPFVQYQRSKSLLLTFGLSSRNFAQFMTAVSLCWLSVGFYFAGFYYKKL